MKRILLTILVLASAVCMQAKVRLPHIYTSHMVLQQEATTKFWGYAEPGKTVTLTTSWDNASRQAVANVHGKWSIDVEAPSWGGPYTISINDSKKAKDAVVLEDVLIGEVWLCGGQSNMEMSMSNWRRGGFVEDMATAHNYPNVRILQVERTTSAHPLEETIICRGGWCAPNAETIRDFSACAFFFGRKLSDELNIPIGLVQSCWGGTLIQDWISGDNLMMHNDFRSRIDALGSYPKEPAEMAKMYEKNMERWSAEANRRDPGYSDGVPTWASADFDDSSWESFKFPGFLQNQGFSGSEMFVWARKSFDIPAEWTGKELKACVGIVDDNDVSFFNGECIGQTDGCGAQRLYTIPASLVKEGKGVISVRIQDIGGLGGITGTLKVYPSDNEAAAVSLEGEWKCKLALKFSQLPPMPVNIVTNPNYPTILYNSMINPLRPLAIRGAIWYQGESNSGKYDQYKDLMLLLIDDWRQKWGDNFSFYLVQLASYMDVQTGAEDSDWARLREAQTEALHMEKTGMAVAIDLGETDDIHPKRKQEVGERLALNALAKDYGKDVEYSGPMFKDFTISSDSITVEFDHADGLRSADGGPVTGFYIAGPNHRFEPAEATIEGNKVVLRSRDVKFPIAVRYGWANFPVCNLYNGAGLPASPFRTDAWPMGR